MTKEEDLSQLLEAQEDLLFNLRDPIVLILIGVPASGKTTIAKHMKELLSDYFDEILILDIDKIRKEMFGEEFKPENESKVRNEQRRRVEEFLGENKVVIVDDLNYFISMRHEFYEIAMDKDGVYFPIYVKAPLQVCIERNNERGNPIPNEKIKEINKKLDIPGIRYTWDHPKLIIDTSVMNFGEIKHTIVSQLVLEIEEHFKAQEKKAEKKKKEEERKKKEEQEEAEKNSHKTPQEKERQEERKKEEKKKRVEQQKKEREERDRARNETIDKYTRELIGKVIRGELDNELLDET